MVGEKKKDGQILLPAPKITPKKVNYLFTVSDNPLPALKRATFLAGIFIEAPVCGFLPTLAFLLETENVPKPTSETLPPFFRVFVTLLKNESRAAFAATLVVLASAAI